jgi:hypothetical protein
MPFSFPPTADWQVLSAAVNRTNRNPATSCEANSEVLTQRLAYAGGCGNQGPQPLGEPGSKQLILTTQNAFSLQYSGADCESATLVYANIIPLSCAHGRSMIAFGSSSGVAPSNLPTRAILQDAADDTTCSGVPTVELYALEACTGYQFVNCSADGSGCTINRFSDQACTQPSSQNVYVAGTSAAPAACNDGSRYFCSFDAAAFINGASSSSSTGSDSGSPSGSGSASGTSSGSASGGVSSSGPSSTSESGSGAPSSSGTDSSFSSTGSIGAASAASVSMGCLALAAIVALVGRQLETGRLLCPDSRSDRHLSRAVLTQSLTRSLVTPSISPHRNAVSVPPTPQPSAPSPLLLSCRADLPPDPRHARAGASSIR